MIVSLFPTPLSNAAALNGVIVVSGRGAGNPRVFMIPPDSQFNVEACRRAGWLEIALLSSKTPAAQSLGGDRVSDESLNNADLFLDFNYPVAL